MDEKVALAEFVPGYSGGTVPDFNGIPFSALRHLMETSFNRPPCKVNGFLARRTNTIMRVRPGV